MKVYNIKYDKQILHTDYIGNSSSQALEQNRGKVQSRRKTKQ
jgi:hypothetical protein